MLRKMQFRVKWKILIRKMVRPFLVSLFYPGNAFRAFKPELIRKILVINLFGMGDLVMGTPLLRILKYSFPEADIYFFVKPLKEDVIRYSIFIKEIILYLEHYKGVTGSLKLRKKLRNIKPDLAIVPFTGLTNIWAALLSNARYKAGFISDFKIRVNFKFDSKLIFHTYAISGARYHPTKAVLSILELLGCDTDSKNDLEIFSNYSAKEHADFILDEHTKWIALNPGSFSIARRWPITKYKDLVFKLNQNILDSGYVIIGGEEDWEICKELYIYIKKMGFKSINACSLISFSSLIEIFKKTKILITGDTGPMHIGFAVGVPVVCLFGPSDPDLRLPQYFRGSIIKNNISCSPCFTGEFEPLCNHFSCMNEITVDEVLPKALDLIEYQ